MPSSQQPGPARACDGGADLIEPPPAGRSPDRAERRPWYDLGFNFTPRGAFIMLGLLVVGVAVFLGIDWVVGQFIDLDEQRISGWIEGFGALAPLVYILVLASTIIFTPLPSVAVNVAGGLVFGLVLGTVYTMIGGMLGATVNFYVARWFGRGFVERRLGQQAMAQIDAMADRMGAKLLVLTRLIPLFNFDWVSYAAGLTHISYRTYALASAAGMLLPVIGIVYVGDVKLTHPGRSNLVFTALVVWSALPVVVFLAWVGLQALHRRVRRPRVPAESRAEPRIIPPARPAGAAVRSRESEGTE